MRLRKANGLLLTLSLVILTTLLVRATDAASSFTSPLPTPDPSIAGPEPLDLQTDEDEDGQPDALIALLRNLDRLDTEKHINPSVETAAKRNAVLKAFEQQLRFNEKTQARQRRVVELRGQLSADLDDGRFAEILQELKMQEGEMAGDPNYAIVDRIVQGWLDGKLAAKARRSFSDPRHTRHGNHPMGSRANSWSEPVTSSGHDNLTYHVFVPGLFGGAFAPDPACQAVNTLPTGQADFAGLIKGDVMFYDGAGKVNNFVYGRKFNHMAIYNGVNSQGIEQIYESDRSYSGDADGGPRLSAIDYFLLNEDVCVALGHFAEDFVDDGAVRAALTVVQGRHGTSGQKPFPKLPPDDLAYWLDKEANDKLYCSQLIWQIFDQAGVNIDSNDSGYRLWFAYKWGAVSWILAYEAWVVSDLLVAPDEIFLHPDLLIDSQGMNP